MAKSQKSKQGSSGKQAARKPASSPKPAAKAAPKSAAKAAPKSAAKAPPKAAPKSAASKSPPKSTPKAAPKSAATKPPPVKSAPKGKPQTQTKGPGLGGRLSRQGVETIGEGVIATFEYGEKIGKAIDKHVAKPLWNAADELMKLPGAISEAWDAEKRARITQRAAAIKRAHPKIPTAMVFKQAQNEDDSGMLK